MCLHQRLGVLNFKVLVKNDTQDAVPLTVTVAGLNVISHAKLIEKP
jgi:hypothetical protein